MREVGLLEFRLLFFIVAWHVAVAVNDFRDSFIISYQDVQPGNAAFTRTLTEQYNLYITCDQNLPQAYGDLVIIQSGTTSTSITDWKDRHTATGELTPFTLGATVFTVTNNNPTTSAQYSFFLYGIKKRDVYDAVPVHDFALLGSSLQLRNSGPGAVTILSAITAFHPKLSQFDVDRSPVASVAAYSVPFPAIDDQQYRLFDATGGAEAQNANLYFFGPIVTIEFRSLSATSNGSFTVSKLTSEEDYLWVDSTATLVSPGWIAPDILPYPYFTGNQFNYKLNMRTYEASGKAQINVVMTVRPAAGDSITVFQGTKVYTTSVDNDSISEVSSAIQIDSSQANSASTRFLAKISPVAAPIETRLPPGTRGTLPTQFPFTDATTQIAADGSITLLVFSTVFAMIVLS